jgi:hypothetical protein
MDSHVDHTGLQSVLDFLDEQSLASRIGQRPIGHAIAARADEHELTLHVATFHQQLLDLACLNEC